MSNVHFQTAIAKIIDEGEPHIFVSNVDVDPSDDWKCKKCGLNIRDKIHLRTRN